MLDVLVVGSGASAVHAAYPMVVAGMRVGMIDVGFEDKTYQALIPNKPFLEIRREDSHQHRYFLGDQFEGVPAGKIKVGPQLTPPRQYIIRDSEKLTPIDSKGFNPFASLALGGMASGWGAGAMGFCRAELEGFPLSYEELQPHYESVAERIGVSGEEDDLFLYDGELKAMLPALEIDQNARLILDRYQKHRKALNKAGLVIGKLRAAALSRKLGSRNPEQYFDMSFWSDGDQSVWRPGYTLKELQKHDGFTYYHPFLVTEFKENDLGHVETSARNIETEELRVITAKKLILAAGVLGTARIVLRSLKEYGTKIPFVCNPYTYYPMINLSMIGKSGEDRVQSLAQLCGVFHPSESNEPMVHARVHSYRSLLNFKITKEMPLPFKEGMRLMNLIQTCLTIVALDHEDRPDPGKFCRLMRGTSVESEKLEIGYSFDEDLRKRQIKQEKIILGLFRKLGCIALKRVWPGFGASLHYGGTFPMGNEEKPLSVCKNGLLRNTRSVFLADGSVFPFLPAKGLTFTMMANANRIGEGIAKEFK